MQDSTLGKRSDQRVVVSKQLSKGNELYQDGGRCGMAGPLGQI